MDAEKQLAEKQLANAKVRKVIGVVDGILTIALIIQIFGFTIYPLVNGPENSRPRNHTDLLKAIEEFRKLPHHKRCFSVGYPGLCMTEPSLDGNGKAHAIWAWIFISILFGMFAIIPVSSSLALIYSTSPTYDDYRAWALTRFWLTGNVMTIFLAFEECIGSAMFQLLGLPIGIPILTLCHLAIRGIFNLIIWKQVNENPNNKAWVATLYDDDFFEMREDISEEKKNKPAKKKKAKPMFQHRIQPMAMPIRAYQDEDLNV